MAGRLKGLEFRSRIVTDGGRAVGKLFLGVLGIEYAIPYRNGGVQNFDVFGMGFGTRPSADKLIYNYYNRTNALDEWAYADGVLPVYLRYQPDLTEPLRLAAEDDSAAPVVYASQWMDLDEPEVIVTGTEAKTDDTGAVVYNDVAVNFVIPINPPSGRKVRLSVQDGSTVFLARIR